MNNETTTEIDRLTTELLVLTDELHDREVEIDHLRQLATIRAARIRELELQVDEAAVLCEGNVRELHALRDALGTLLSAVEKVSAA